jgi:hypothetical protein
MPAGQLALDLDPQLAAGWRQADLVDERADDVEGLVARAGVVQGLVHRGDLLAVELGQVGVDQRRRAVATSSARSSSACRASRSFSSSFSTLTGASSSVISSTSLRVRRRPSGDLGGFADPEARNDGFHFYPICYCNGRAYLTLRPPGPTGGTQTGDRS